MVPGTHPQASFGHLFGYDAGYPAALDLLSRGLAWLGLVLLFGWTFAFFYHLCNGIRHLAWDAGYGFELRTAHPSGYTVLAATVVLTVLAWLSVWLI